MVWIESGESSFHMVFKSAAMCLFSLFFRLMSTAIRTHCQPSVKLSR
jgi:hypothetical protein